MDGGRKMIIKTTHEIFELYVPHGRSVNKQIELQNVRWCRVEEVNKTIEKIKKKHKIEVNKLKRKYESIIEDYEYNVKETNDIIRKYGYNTLNLDVILSQIQSLKVRSTNFDSLFSEEK
jgi:hypothetical protein